jgi:hypothetical protein
LPEGLLERRDLRRDPLAIVEPDHRLGHDDVAGECAVAIDAEDLGPLAHVRPAGAAVEAHPAGDMALGRDEVAGAHVFDSGADVDDGAGELVPQGQRWPNALRRPGVPVVDVEVGPTDAGGLDLHEHLVRPRTGNRNLHELESGAPPQLPDRPGRLHR